MSSPAETISRYFDGVLTREEIAELEAWLHADPANMRTFAQAGLIHTRVYELLNRQDLSRLLPWRVDDSATGLAAVDDDASPLLEALALEQEARARSVPAPPAEPQPPTDDRDYTWCYVTPEPEPPVRHIVIPRAVAYATVGTMAAMLLLMIYSMMRPESTSPQAPPPPLVASLPSVARLGLTYDARWLPGASPSGESALLHPGVYTLESGVARVHFNDGASMLVEGPTTFELLSERSARLIAGKVLGQVGMDASGLIIHTPNATVVDLGTEFGVRTVNGSTELHVYEGAVALTPDGQDTAPSHKQQIARGQAREVDRDGRVHVVSLNELAFVREREFEARIRAREGSRYHAWLALSYELRRRTDVLAYYTFEPNPQDTLRLHNQASTTRGRFEGRLGDGHSGFTRPTWTTGRFTNKTGLLFNEHDRQRVFVEDTPFSDNRDVVTVTAWVQLHSDQGFQLVLSQWWEDEADSEYFFHFGITGPGNTDDVEPQPPRVYLKLADETIGRFLYKDELYSGTSTYAQHQWVHLAFTIQAGGAIRMYKNGVEVDSREQIYPPSTLPRSTQPLVLGGKTTTDWGFSGVIDEVVIFDRVLDSNEIRHLYESSRPD